MLKLKLQKKMYKIQLKANFLDVSPVQSLRVERDSGLDIFLGEGDITNNLPA